MKKKVSAEDLLNAKPPSKAQVEASNRYLKLMAEGRHVVLLGAGASLACCPRGDKNGKKLPVMSNLVETVGLKELLQKEGYYKQDSNFEAVYNDIVEKRGKDDYVQDIDDRVYDYFSEITIPDAPTPYDYIILSLGPKDIVATFNWDPLLAQAYIRNIPIKELPQMAHLHGNVMIGVCYEDKKIGFLFSKHLLKTNRI